MVIVVQPSSELIFGHSPLAEMFFGFAYKNPDTHFVFLLEKELNFLSKIPQNVRIEKIPSTTKNKLTDYYWRRLKLPAILQKKKANYFITNTFPASNYGQTKTVYLSPQSFSPPLLSAPVSIFSGEAEESFFACFLNPNTMDKAVMVLKAFSIFKRRLKSGYKLYFISETTEAQKMIPGFGNYKYKEDVSFFTVKALAEFQYYVKNALGYLYFPTKDYDKYLLRTALQQGSIVITNQPDNLPSYLQNAVISITATAEELAEKMMLLYKDENLQSAYKNLALQTISSEPMPTLQSMLAGEYDYLKPV